MTDDSVFLDFELIYFHKLFCKFVLSIACTLLFDFACRLMCVEDSVSIVFPVILMSCLPGKPDHAADALDAAAK